MAEIDSLELKIIADATSASASIDKFVASLERLSVAMAGIQDANGLNQVATGISNLGTAMQSVASIDSRKFDTLANNITKLGNVGSSNLSAAANGIFDLVVALDSVNGTAPETSANVANLANAVGRLGSANIERAVTNIPVLTAALRDMLTSLSTAPQISQNIIEMTNALANLAMQTRGMQTNTNNVATGFTNLTHRARSSARSMRSLASAFGLFYAKFGLLIRGIRQIWSSTQSAMDYVETFNYYTVALNKIGKTTAQAFGEMGANDAEAYTEKFTEKLKTLNKKMTGYIVGDNGELIDTDSIGLGLNPEKLMNFQAQILGITNSVGLLGDASTNTAKALSMLSSDLSSLTNTDLETVMGNLRSGLIGQSRALYKYGIDITSATLKQYALANGISKSVTEMSQSEKMQLRLLAILDQSRIAWGDQARTINTVANQYRILKQQVSNLGRIIGNLLLPVVKAVLPYINAFIIVLQRLFTMLGFKLWGGSWLKDLNEDISAIGAGADDIDGLSDSLDDAADSAKKLKGQLLGIDELNVINSKDDSGSGKLSGFGGIDLSGAIDDALAEYESVWDEAFRNAKNKAEKIADAIMNALKTMSPYDIGKAIAEKFNDIDWSEAFTNIARSFTKMFNNVVHFILGFVENFNFSEFGSAIGDGINYAIEHIDLVAFVQGAFHIVVGLLDALIAMIDRVNWSDLGRKIGKALASIKWSVLLGKVAKAILKAIGAGLKLYGNTFLEAPILTTLLTVFGALRLTGITTMLSRMMGTVVTNMLTSFRTAFVTGFRNLMSYLGGAGMAALGIGVLVAAIATFIISETLKATKQSAIDSVYSALSADKLAQSGFNGVTSFTALTDSYLALFDTIESRYTAMQEALAQASSSRTELDETVASINNMVSAVEMGAYTIEEKAPEIVDALTKMSSEIQQVMDDDYDAIIMGISGAVGDAYEALGGSASDLVSALAEAKTGGDETLAELEKSVAELNAQFESGEITATEYYNAAMPLYEKMAAVANSGQIDDVATQMENLNGALDLSKFINGSSFDSAAFESYFSDVTTTVQDGMSALEQSGADYEATVNDFTQKLSALGVDIDANYITGVLNANTKAVDDGLNEYKEGWEAYTNQIQVGLVNQLPSIIQEAENRYENELNPFQKLLTPKSEYVETAVEEWRNNVVAPMETEIQKSFSEMNLIGDTWAGDAVDTMFSALNTSLSNSNHEILDDNWQAILEGMLTDVNGMLDMDTWSQEMVQGYAQGIENASGDCKTPIETWADSMIKWFHDSSLDFGSPSRTMEAFGYDAVQGFANGLNNSDSNSYLTRSIDEFSSKVINAFKSRLNSFESIGASITRGIANGMKQGMSFVSDSAAELASTIKNTIQKELQIHSPSRVMFKLGEYTIEGFLLGLESLFGKTEKEMTDFTGEIAKAPSLKYNTPKVNTPQTGQTNISSTLAPMIYDAVSSALGNSQTNVNVTLEGDANKLFKVVKEESSKYTRRTGSSAFA